MPQRSSISERSFHSLPPNSRAGFVAARLVTIALGCIGFGLYQVYGKNPQVLDANETRADSHSDVRQDILDISPWIPYSMEDVEAYLLSRQGNVVLESTSDTLRADYIQLESNSPMEDTISVLSGFGGDDGFEWLSAGVYDGHWLVERFNLCDVTNSHRGVETAFVLRNLLLQYVTREMVELQRALYPNAAPESARKLENLQPHQIDMAIRTAFLSLDRDLIEGGADAVTGDRFLNDAMAGVAASYAGSCALFALYERKTKMLRVACTGDSRAVLGCRNADGEWEAKTLSVDQTGYNESEVARLHALHPGEPDIVKNGRVLGLAVSRAFGDGLWKVYLKGN